MSKMFAWYSGDQLFRGKRWLFAVLSIAGMFSLAVGFLGCGKETAQARIGVILPLTGDGASYGQEIKKGIDLAVDEVNKAGGVRGKTVDLLYEDSQGLPAPATSALQKLITQYKIQLVIGDSFSSPTLAINPIAQREQIVLLTPTASSPKLSGAGKFFFRVWPSDVAEGSAIAEFAVSKLGYKRFAALYSTSEYGIGLRDVFINTVERLGGKIVFNEGYRDGDSDFRAQIAKIRQTRPEAVYMPGYYKEFAKILRQAKELGLRAQFLSSGTFREPKLLELAGRSAEGVIFVQPYFDPSSEDPRIKKFAAAYKSKYGIEVGLYAAHGYDAMKVAAFAMEKGGLTGPEIQKVMAAIRDFPGVTGNISFDEKGDVVKPVRIMTIKDGRFSDLPPR